MISAPLVGILGGLLWFGLVGYSSRPNHELSVIEAAINAKKQCELLSGELYSKDRSQERQIVRQYFCKLESGDLPVSKALALHSMAIETTGTDKGSN